MLLVLLSLRKSPEVGALCHEFLKFCARSWRQRQTYICFLLLHILQEPIASSSKVAFWILKCPLVCPGYMPALLVVPTTHAVAVPSPWVLSGNLQVS